MRWGGVTKTWNQTLRNFPVIYVKNFDLGLGIPKLKILGFLGQDTVRLQGEESGK